MPRLCSNRNRGVAGAKALTAALLTVLLAVYAVNRLQAHKEQMANWGSILERDPGYRLFQAGTATCWTARVANASRLGRRPCPGI